MKKKKEENGVRKHFILCWKYIVLQGSYTLHKGL